MAAMYITRDGVTVTRNARIIYIYYANSGVTTYRISDKDLTHFLMLVYIKCIYEIPFSKFRKCRSLSPLRGTVAPPLIATSTEKSPPRRKKENMQSVGIYRGSATFGRVKSPRGRGRVQWFVVEYQHVSGRIAVWNTIGINAGRAARARARGRARKDEINDDSLSAFCSFSIRMENGY